MPIETGRRDILLRVPPELLRKHAMVGVGLRLGLDPPGTIAREVPRLRSVEEGIEPCHMPNAVYIGSGHLGFRLSAGPLAPQCLPGPDGDAATSLVRWL